MGILSSIRSRLSSSPRREEARPAVSASAAQSTVRTGGTVPLVGSSWQALQIATVYRCVQVLGGSVAALPLKYLKRASSGVYREDDGSRLSRLLAVEPDTAYNAFDFWDQAVRQILLRGNAYIIPVWSLVNLGEIEKLVLCSPGSVAYDSTSGTYTVSDIDNGIGGVFGERDVIHLKNLSLDGKNGLSVLSFARMTMSIAGSGDSETLNRFANGGNVRGLLTNDTSVRGFGEYRDDELKASAQKLDERFRAGERIVNLPGQAQFQQLSLSSVDMEFLSTRKFSVREICRFFGVPPSYVFDDGATNYKSAELANVDFLSQTLNPLLTKIEKELLRKLVAPHRYHRFKFEFDRRALYATDLSGRADYQTKTIASGVYTINDWRRYENKPEVPEGDRVLVSANLKPLDALVREGDGSDGDLTDNAV